MGPAKCRKNILIVRESIFTFWYYSILLPAIKYAYRTGVLCLEENRLLKTYFGVRKNGYLFLKPKLPLAVFVKSMICTVTIGKSGCLLHCV